MFPPLVHLPSRVNSLFRAFKQSNCYSLHLISHLALFSPLFWQLQILLGFHWGFLGPSLDLKDANFYFNVLYNCQQLIYCLFAKLLVMPQGITMVLPFS